MTHRLQGDSNQTSHVNSIEYVQFGKTSDCYTMNSNLAFFIYTSHRYVYKVTCER